MYIYIYACDLSIGGERGGEKSAHIYACGYIFFIHLCKCVNNHDIYIYICFLICHMCMCVCVCV